MKKIIITALSIIFFAACAKNSEMTEVSGPETAPVTYVAGDLFRCEEFAGGGAYVDICLDMQGNVALMYDKGYLFIFDPNTLNPNFLDCYNGYGNTDYSSREENFREKYEEYGTLYNIPRSMCADAQNDYYYITNENQLLKYIWAERKFNDISGLFPANSIFLSLVAADNGNVFVAVGDESNGEYGDTFPSHKVYRIGVTGKPVEIAVVDAPVSAVLAPSDWYELYQYNDILLKSNGAFLYGLSSNGKIYKTNTVSGAVEYFTPRVPVDCLAAALTKNNPYAVSGNQIIELRLSMAKDVVVGTIPDSVIGLGAPTIIRANSDASAFYMNGYFEYEYSGEMYKYSTWYKLSL